MSQQQTSSFPIDPFTTSGTELGTILNELQDAYKSTQSGTSRPAYSVQGFQWVDISDTLNAIKYFTGTLDLSIVEYDTVANTAIINGGISISDKTKAILHKISKTASTVPNKADMREGEIIINVADATIYFLDENGNVSNINVPQDTFVKKSGDTMTGQLKGIVPVADEDFTIKIYVDTQIAQKTTPAEVDTKVATHAGIKSSAVNYGHAKMDLSGTTLTITTT